MGKRGRPSGPQRASNQSTIEGCGLLPRIENPQSIIGKTLTLPGSYWDWRSQKDAAAKEDVLFECVISDFDAIHKWDEASKPSCAAFQLQDPESELDGSHSHFWMQYPSPFLKHWYKTHPLPGTEKLEASDDNSQEENAGTSSRPTQDPTSGVYKHAKFHHKEELVRRRPKPGQKAKIKRCYTCQVKTANGICGDPLSIVDYSTSNAIGHFRRRAGAGCAAHQEALNQIEEINTQSVNVNDEQVPVFSFREAFPHHCDFVYMVADGCPQELKKKQSFQDYIRGYEPRATMPHSVTIHRIAECIEELQAEDQHESLCKHCHELGDEECLAAQLDLWTDEKTNICYAALTLTRVRDGTTTEPCTCALESELLEFEQFPHTSHTAVMDLVDLAAAT